SQHRKAMWLQSLVGSTQRVLVERSGRSGHAENFAPARIALGEHGKVSAVRVTRVEHGFLIGEPV
ncbi:MAG: TRAM domain-containing protein, partial [Pseudomonadota bacterium]|nr:TRAM domain-containing protein [Pseudomonadota bacterium]